MKVGNKEIKLYYSNLASRQISEMLGGIKNFARLLRDENGEALEITEQYTNIMKLLCILANAEIARFNREIALGIRDDEKKEKFTVEDFEELLDISKADEYLMEALEVMGLASKFETPDNIKMESRDRDLEEIEAEKNP